jgi:hypothetical protein
MAQWEHNPEGAIMQPTDTSPEEFSIRSKDGETYHLKFIIDDKNGKIECWIHNEKFELVTTKVSMQEDC